MSFMVSNKIIIFAHYILRRYLKNGGAKMNQKMIKLLSSIVMTAACTAIFLGCDAEGEGSAPKESTGDSKLVTVSGSTSVGPLMEVLGERYEDGKDYVSVEIQQIGSSAGIKNAISGVSQIGMSSRDLKEDEAKEVSYTAIAYDGIVLIVNKENTIRDLSIDEIRGIYTGEITNWSSLGGEDRPIIVVSREEGSGTRDSFQEIIGFESSELLPRALIGDGNGSIKTTVQGNKNSIGYISFDYLDDSIIGLKCDGVEPTAENVLDGIYSLSRPFLIVYKEENLKGEAGEFVNYILSEEGQSVVEESGNIRVK